MSADQFRFYKGFELQALVFTRAFARFDGHSRYAEGYDVAVRITRAKVPAPAPAQVGRVFRLDQQTVFADFGIARRAAFQRGQEIVDGKVDGASVSDI